MRLSLKTRSYLIFFPLVILIAILLLFAVSFYRSIGGEVREFHQSAEELIHAERCAVIFELYISEYSHFILTGNQEHRQEMEQLRSEAGRIMNLWKQRIDTHRKEEDYDYFNNPYMPLDDIEKMYSSVEQAGDKSIALFEQAKKDDAIKAFYMETAPIYDVLSSKMKMLVSVRETVSLERLMNLETLAGNYGILLSPALRLEIKNMYPDLLMTILAERFQREVNGEVKSLFDFIATGSTEDKLELNEFSGRCSSIIARWKKIADDLKDKNEVLCRRQVELLSELNEEYGILTERKVIVLSLAREGKTGEALEYLKNNIEPLSSAFSKKMDIHITNEEKEIEGEIISMSSSISRIETGIGVLVVIIITIVISVFIFLVKQIIGPVLKLKEAAILMGKGNLSSRVNIERNDEIGELADAFNQMAASISEKTVSKEYVENIISSMAESLVVISTTGFITNANPALYRMLGYEEGELIGKKLSTIFPVKLPFNGTETKDDDTYWIIQNKETEYRTKEGNSIPVSFSASIMRDDDGKALAIICVAQDITKQKKETQVREKLITDLQGAIANIKTLSGLIPICASCKKIRDDSGYWNMVESYISEHSEAEFTHSICPECAEKLYGYVKK
ncbi:MAG: PAS domain S-box protein [Candidatus Schekmanbacteria bacterium]|nr:PAS domain S-box protein [Candidatus Schekmanbacteria bacterium]